MRGGGRHKDNKKRSEKKQAASAKENGQMSTEEQKSDEGPVTQRVDKDSMIRQLEESEGYQKILEHREVKKKCTRKCRIIWRTFRSCRCWVRSSWRI